MNYEWYFQNKLTQDSWGASVCTRLWFFQIIQLIPFCTYEIMKCGWLTQESFNPRNCLDVRRNFQQIRHQFSISNHPCTNQVDTKALYVFEVTEVVDTITTTTTIGEGWQWGGGLFFVPFFYNDLILGREWWRLEKKALLHSTANQHKFFQVGTRVVQNGQQVFPWQFTIVQVEWFYERAVDMEKSPDKAPYFEIHGHILTQLIVWAKGVATNNYFKI